MQRCKIHLSLDVRSETCAVDCVFYIRAFRACTRTWWKYRSISNQGHDKRGEIWMSLITCGSIHQGYEWFCDDSRGKQEIFMCLAALLCEQFCRFARNGSRCQDIDQVLLHEIIFSSSEVLGKNAFIRSKLPTTACWFREGKKGKPTCFMSKATSVPQTNHSQTVLSVFFPRWGVKFGHRVKISARWDE